MDVEYYERENIYVLKVETEDLEGFKQHLTCLLCGNKIDITREMPYFCPRKEQFIHKKCLCAENAGHYFKDESNHIDFPIGRFVQVKGGLK